MERMQELSADEINKLLESGKVKEIKILKKMDDKYIARVEYVPDAEEISEWVIDVWNCHGVLKRREWGLGYGNIPEIPEQECKWANIGRFTVPLRRRETLTDEEKTRTKNILYKILERNGGAINISGFYAVYNEEIEQIKTALRGKLYC